MFRAFALGLALLLLAPAPHAAAGVTGAAPPDAALPGSELVQALRQGGLVVFLRHAETGPPNPDQGSAIIGDCTTQRPLIEAGRAQAVAIGEAFRALGIPVGRVLASPFCRTMETATLAFGRAEPEFALSLPRHTDPPAHAAMGRALLGLLPRASEVPGAGNLVLVGHSYHLIAAGGPRPNPQGAAAVLRPDGRGGFQVLALLPPEAWSRLAHPSLAAVPR